MPKHAVVSSVVDKLASHHISLWKDKFKGEKCFCVGNGPSLKHTPLHLLQNEYTFGLNGISKIYPSTTWRPSFYVNVTVGATDPGWAKEARKSIAIAPSFVEFGLLPYVLESVDGRINIPRHILPIDAVKDRKWSYDITKGVSKYGSSMLAVMQVAVYMGFKQLVLVGCDAKWIPFDFDEDKDPNHFVDDYWGKLNVCVSTGGRKDIVVTPTLAKRFSSDAQNCHTFARESCEPIGVEIYNATIGGDLEVHKRVDLVEAINGQV